MRVTFCWPGISGYMAACWRALAGQEGMELSLLVTPASVPFNRDLLHGLNVRILGPEEAATSKVCDIIAQTSPEIVVLGGWAREPWRRIPFDRRLKGAKFVMGMDTPWRGTWRQRLGRLKVGRYLDRMDRVVVAGERAFVLATKLGIPEGRILRGVYGFDEDLFQPVAARRLARPGGYPRQFLYMGRYTPVKGIDTLLAAYQLYRGRTGEAWPLVCCGSGPLKPLLAGVEGIEDRGFVNPPDQPAVLEDSGVFVLASNSEPWGVVIAEALGSGMPVVCTEACGASVSMVRSYYNGLTVGTGDAAALARALLWMHRHHPLLAEMGRRGQELARPFAARNWACRWRETFDELLGLEQTSQPVNVTPGRGVSA